MSVIAPKIMIRPISAFFITRFACSKFAGLPELVIYAMPPLIKKKTAAKLPSPHKVYTIGIK